MQVVPFDKADPTEMYTLSARGVTAKRTAERVDFTDLSRWLVETERFHALRRKRSFRLFRLWKSYTLWGRATRKVSVARASNALTRNLFLADAHLQVCVFVLRANPGT